MSTPSGGTKASRRINHFFPRAFALAALVAVCGVIVALSTTPAISAASTITLTPIADSYVNSSSSTVNTNFGTATVIQQDSASTSQMVSYLTFSVTGLSAAPTSAILNLTSEVSGSTPINVLSVADTTWSETGITWTNKPATGATIGKTGSLAVGVKSSVDVTSAIKGNGTYSFALTDAATAARKVDSREAGSNGPQLVLTADTGSTTSPASTSSAASSTAASSTAASSTAASSTAASSTAASSTPASSSASTTSSDPVIVIGGDIACAPADPNYNGGNGTSTACHMKNTAAQISAINPVALLPLGDEQYNSGNLTDFAASYGKSWGVSSLLNISHPVVGNHEYGTSGAGGYFGFFGIRAKGGQSCTSGCEGYYSYNVGSWHIVAINTECTRIDSGTACATGSPQEKWLKADLAANKQACTLVYGHRPRWSSNSFASADIAPLIADMYPTVDIYASGHSHAYERFKPQNPSGAVDNSQGITQLIVGTGGSFYTGFGTILANSVTHKSNLFGIMKMTLHANSADYTFLPENSTYTDSGTVNCH